MKLPPHPYIDLTAHLGSLKASLTPPCRHFTPAPPLHISAEHPLSPAKVCIALLLGMVILTAILLSSTLQ